MKTDIHNKDFARRLVLIKKKGELGNGLLVGCPVLMSVERYPVKSFCAGILGSN